MQREFRASVELGRQSDGREELYSCRQLGDGHWRGVIARLDEQTLSRRHALLEPLDDDHVRLTNLSTKVAIGLPDGTELVAAAARDLALPADLHVGCRHLCLEPVADDDAILHSLPPCLLMTGLTSFTTTRFPKTLSADHVAMEELLHWLQTLVGVLQSAANASDFFQKAADAVVEMVGLHSGRVLLRDHDAWTTVAGRRAGTGDPDKPLSPASLHVLRRVVQERRTFWQAQDLAALPTSASLVNVESVVAAPILDAAGAVIGAIYGDCLGAVEQPARPLITRVEAMLVELLAGGVGAGLARVEQEKKALEADIRFSQFFTRELSRQLAQRPDLLDGRDAEATILFGDIRGFSRICERVGPATTVACLRDVMDELSDCVLAQRGVLVDYLGDALLAMWGAPEEQGDHACLACRAALAMLARLPVVNARWQEQLGEPVVLGIGLSSGVVHVGNMGSRYKFKYGPLGHHVNLAHRVQGATKYLHARLLVTEFTRADLGADFNTRRLCQVRVVNMERPVNLYELVPDDTPGWLDLKTQYEGALDAFEQRRFRAAVNLLGALLAAYPDDGPSLVLLARAVAALVAETAPGCTVWDLPGK